MRKSTSICALGLALAMAIGGISTGATTTQAVVDGDYEGFVADQTASGPSVTATPTVSQATLNLTSVNKMAGKSFKLTISNLTPGSSLPKVEFVSGDEAVASVSDSSFSTDQTSASATVTLLKAGTTQIDVHVNDEVYTCAVKAVAKFGKKDFSGYRPKSFTSDCYYHIKKKRYTYYFDGEWGKPAKYGTTYRGVKIGTKKSTVESLYGELKLTKCKKSKDPFLYDKQFNSSSKKLKVSKYANFSTKVSGIKYNLRIYFTSSNKVYGFILLGGKDFNKITKSMLKNGKRSDMKLI